MAFDAPANAAPSRSPFGDLPASNAAPQPTAPQVVHRSPFGDLPEGIVAAIPTAGGEVGLNNEQLHQYAKGLEQLGTVPVSPNNYVPQTQLRKFVGGVEQIVGPAADASGRLTNKLDTAIGLPGLGRAMQVAGENINEFGKATHPGVATALGNTAGTATALAAGPVGIGLLGATSFLTPIDEALVEQQQTGKPVDWTSTVAKSVLKAGVDTTFNKLLALGLSGKAAEALLKEVTPGLGKTIAKLGIANAVGAGAGAGQTSADNLIEGRPVSEGLKQSIPMMMAMETLGVGVHGAIHPEARPTAESVAPKLADLESLSVAPKGEASSDLRVDESHGQPEVPLPKILESEPPKFRVQSGAESVGKPIDFESPADKALYWATEPGRKGKRTAAAIQYLKDRGYTDEGITKLGGQVRERVQQEASFTGSDTIRIPKSDAMGNLDLRVAPDVGEADLRTEPGIGETDLNVGGGESKAQQQPQEQRTATEAPEGTEGSPQLQNASESQPSDYSGIKHEIESKGGTFDVAKPKNKEQTRVAKALKDVAGIDVVWGEGKGWQGFSHPNHTGKIFLNRNLGGDALKEATVHEAWHQIQDNLSRLANEGHEALGPNGIEQGKKVYAKLLSSSGLKGVKVSDREGAAVAMQKLMKGSAFDRASRSWLQKAIAIVKDRMGLNKEKLNPQQVIARATLDKAMAGLKETLGAKETGSSQGKEGSFFVEDRKPDKNWFTLWSWNRSKNAFAKVANFPSKEEALAYYKEHFRAQEWPVQIRSFGEAPKQIEGAESPFGKGEDPTSLTGSLLPEGNREVQDQADEGLTEDKVRNGDYAVFTAENPNNQSLSPEENAQRTARLAEDLGLRGRPFYPTVGHYGGPEEHSFLVPDMSPHEALEYGKKYGQESVLHSRHGLIYQDRTVTPKAGDVIVGDEAKNSGFYSTLPNGTHFSVPLDFDAPKGEGSFLPYGHWISPTGDDKPVLDEMGHEDVAREVVGKTGTQGLLDQGWIRIVNGPHGTESIEHQKPLTRLQLRELTPRVKQTLAERGRVFVDGPSVTGFHDKINSLADWNKYVSADQAGSFLPGSKPAKEFVEGTKGVFEGIKSLIAPQTRSREARSASFDVRRMGAELAQRTGRVNKAFDAATKFMAKLPVEQTRDFIHRIETGAKQAAPELQPIADAIRYILDDRLKAVQGLGTGALHQFVENYFPHLYKDPAKAAGVMKDLLGRRPLQGGKGFLKKRSIPTLQEAIERGLEPLTENPVEAMMMRVHQMDKYITANEMLQALERKGLAQWKTARTPLAPGMAKLDDPIGIRYAKPNRRGAIQIAKVVHVPEPVANVINNHLRPGIASSKYFGKAFRGYRTVSNLMNMVQLGISAFHPAFATGDAAAGQLSLAIDQAIRGRFIQAGKNAALAGTVIGPAVRNIVRGSLILKEWYHPGSTTPEIAQFVELLKKAGGRVALDSHYRTDLSKRMMEAFRRGNVLGGVARAPFAAIEKAAAPIMEYMIPRMKAGAFMDLMANEMDKLGAGATEEDIQRIAARSWDSIDNRLGQLVYDNMFWNRHVKDLAMASTRAVGWNVGTLRELGGGLFDALNQGQRAVRGKGFDLTPRLAYTVAMPLFVGSIGAVMNYLFTGKGPQELKDYFFPKTGEKDKTGHDVRMALPSYMKDVFAYASEPGRTVLDKTHPFLNTVLEILNNQDYYGTEIRHPDDPAMKQLLSVAKFVGQQSEPFSIRNVEQLISEGQGKRALLPLIGFVPARKDLSETDAELKASEIAAAGRAMGSRTTEQAERAKLVRDLAYRFRNGDKTARADLETALKSGVLKPADVTGIRKRLKHTGLVFQVMNMSASEAMQVWDVSSPSEKKELVSVVLKKLRASKTLTPADKAPLIRRVVADWNALKGVK